MKIKTFVCFRLVHWINWLACLTIWENWMPMLRQVLARSLLISETFSKISVTNCLKTYWPITVSDYLIVNTIDIDIKLFLFLQLNCPNILHVSNGTWPNILLNNHCVILLISYQSRLVRLMLI